MKNVVHLCDCMEFMKGIPDKYYNLAICDPPYGIGMDNSNKRTKPSRPNSYTDYPDFRYHKSDWDTNAPDKEYFDELFRVSKNQIIWGANYFNDKLPPGFGWIFWNKKNGLDNCFSDGEFAFSSKGVQSRLVELSQFDGLRGGKDRIHPTQKPIKLYKWLLKNYAKPNDKIFDSHVGSGSIRIACHDMGFDFEGCELDKDYWEAQEERYNTYISQQDLFSGEELQEIIYSDRALI